MKIERANALNELMKNGERLIRSVFFDKKLKTRKFENEVENRTKKTGKSGRFMRESERGRARIDSTWKNKRTKRERFIRKRRNPIIHI